MSKKRATRPTLREQKDSAAQSNEQAHAAAVAMFEEEYKKDKITLLTRHLTAAKLLQNTSASYFRKIEYQRKNKGRYPLSEVLGWKAVFDVYDVDKSGTITMEEFNDASQHAANLIEQLKFSDLDSDHDGVITFKELLQAVYQYASATQIDWMVDMAYPEGLPKIYDREKKRALTRAQKAEITSIFRAYDTDGSDTLSLDELTEALTNSGYDMNEMKKLFSDNDFDRNKQLSLEEFVVLIADAYLN
eukprot:Opistho-2@93175